MKSIYNLWKSIRRFSKKNKKDLKKKKHKIEN